MSQENQHPVTLIHGRYKEHIRLKIWFRIFFLAIREYRSLIKTTGVLKKLARLRKNFAGESKFNRFVKAGNRYYWHMHLPGYPSSIFDHHFLGGLNRMMPVKSSFNRLSTAFIGLTNICPLRCHHCYHWVDLNKPDRLSLDDLKQIIQKLQERGVTQIHFLGGEPMTRFGDLLELTKCFKDHSEIWISTSGYRLDHDKAIALKEAGMTGIAISIDHFEEEKHNAFRGHKEAFSWGINATKCCSDAGLLTCWSPCVTKDLIRPGNLMAYARMAASHKVNFIQIFEPMASGRYSGTDVQLDESESKILEDFYIRMNRNNEYLHFPIIVYSGYHQRRIGCLGGGDRYLYIDTVGMLHPCPFCQSKKELNFIENPFDQLLAELKEEKCHYTQVGSSH